MNHYARRRNGTWKSDPGFIYARLTNQYPRDHDIHIVWDERRPASFRVEPAKAHRARSAIARKARL